MTHTSRKRLPAIALVVCTLAATVRIAFLILDQVSGPDQNTVHAVTQAAAAQLERTPIQGLGLTIIDIQQAIDDNARDDLGHGYASQLTVTDVGHTLQADLYEITNSHGRNPVCLTVTITINPYTLGTQPQYPTTEVTDGHCPTP